MKKYKVKIKKIIPIGKHKSYDLHVNSKTHSYIANGFITHNSLHSGQTMLYVNRHLGKEEVKYEHPLLEEITKKTLGIIMYQEQVMHVMTQIGKMSWATAEMARKVITKSKGAKAFENMRAEFIRNAVKFNKMEERDAMKLFDVVSTFGCLTGNTKIYRASANQHKGVEVTIEEAFEYQKSDNFKHRKLKILSMSADGFVRPHTIKQIHDTGKKKVFYIRTESNKYIYASAEHRFLVDGGWVKVKNMKLGQHIQVTNRKLPKGVTGIGLGKGSHKTCPKHRKGQGYTNGIKKQKEKLLKKYGGCQICGSKEWNELHHINHNIKDNSDKNTMLLCRKHHKEVDGTVSCARFQTGYYTHREKITDIIPSIERQTYDIEMEDVPRNFIANGFVSHNSYSFNLTHAVSYSIISYWCAWLKTYYPQHFMKAILKYENVDTQLSNYLQECDRLGIEVEYPHINKSKTSYSIADDKIYAGFDSIKGIGVKTAQKIIKGQPYESFEDFIKKCKVSKKVLKGLAIADAFRDWKVNKKLIATKELKEINNYYDKITSDYTDIEYAQIILEKTSLHPKVDIQATFDFGDYEFTDIRDTGEQVAGQQCKVRGIVTEVVNKDKLLRMNRQEHAHRFEQHMLFVNINDGTGNMAVQVNPWTYEQYNSFINNLEGKPLTVFGVFSRSGNKVYASMLQLPGKTHDIDNYYKNVEELKEGETIIFSAIPAVSKNKKSYYRLTLSDGTQGLCFSFLEKLFAGMKVKAKMTREPFMDLEVIKDGKEEKKKKEN